MEEPSEWIEVGLSSNPRDGEQRALVLVAVGISARLEPRPGGIALLVAANDAARARQELAAYERENVPPPRPRQPERPFSEGVTAAMLACAVLVAVHVAATHDAFSHDWLTAGEAQAGRMASGEWWRVFTALTLHADLEHLLGNVSLGCLLGLFVSQGLGAGLAWLTILLAGGIGNGLDALLHPAAHTAIGASTAVFGAVGILSTLSLTRQISRWTRGLRRWLPLLGGATLLVFLGLGGENTDVGAHLAGFLVGCLLGLGFTTLGTRIPHGTRAQYVYGTIAVGLLVLAWVLAFAAGPSA